MIPLVLNMLYSANTENDLILLEAALRSVAPVIDQAVFLDTTKSEAHRNKGVEVLESTMSGRYRYMSLPEIIDSSGFADARNLMLDFSPRGCYILWQDSDEVHFTDELLRLKEIILSTEEYDDIAMHFVHFCIGSNYYEKFERRVTIFKRTSDETIWANKVHEKVVHQNPDRKVFESGYYYHHYGYCRGQDYVYDRWHQYAKLEGQDTPSIEQEYPDKQVLNHRKDSLLPYFGQYPAALPTEWVNSKLVYI